MKKFLGKSYAIAFISVVLFVVFSCEEDFTDLESGVLKNNVFSTGEVELDIKITPFNVENVSADNINLPVLSSGAFPTVEYWLGVYDTIYAKKIEAGFVSQLSLPTTLTTSEIEIDGDTIYSLDKVVLKLPYTALSLGDANSDGETDGIIEYRLDSILGNKNVSTTVDVYQNPFFLNTLNPTNPANNNAFNSDFPYNETNLLSEVGFSFMPKATDTIFTFERIDRSLDVNSTTTYIDTLTVTSSDVPVPFLAIPLNYEKMKELFWDKFEDPEFSESTLFQDHFKGVIVQGKGDDGALVPFNLNSASIDFLYSKTVFEDNAIDSVYNESYSFSLSGVRNVIYKMSDATPSPTNNFVLQGTSGSNASIEILGVNLNNLDQDHSFQQYADKDVNNDNYLDLEELSSIKTDNSDVPSILINDAELSLNINSEFSDNLFILPLNLYLYQNLDESSNVVDTQISDSYEESNYGGGIGLFDDDDDDETIGIPDNYTFKITDFISDFIDGSSTNFGTKLIVKTENVPTDGPLITGFLDLNIRNYNWNPRSVVLYNESADETKKAQLKILYTELKK